MQGAGQLVRSISGAVSSSRWSRLDRPGGWPRHGLLRRSTPLASAVCWLSSNIARGSPPACCACVQTRRSLLQSAAAVLCQRAAAGSVPGRLPRRLRGWCASHQRTRALAADASLSRTISRSGRFARRCERQGTLGHPRAETRDGLASPQLQEVGLVPQAAGLIGHRRLPSTSSQSNH